MNNKVYCCDCVFSGDIYYKFVCTNKISKSVDYPIGKHRQLCEHINKNNNCKHFIDKSKRHLKQDCKHLSIFYHCKIGKSNEYKMCDENCISFKKKNFIDKLFEL